MRVTVDVWMELLSVCHVWDRTDDGKPGNMTNTPLIVFRSAEIRCSGH